MNTFDINNLLAAINRQTLAMEKHMFEVNKRLERIAVALERKADIEAPPCAFPPPQREE